jgi:hypothetical protein
MSAKLYNEILPDFLHNRPKPFVEHCKKKIPRFTNLSISDVECLDELGQFKVNSETEGSVYEIDMNIAKCSCSAWDAQHLTCKHMLTVLILALLGINCQSIIKTPFYLDNDIFNSGKIISIGNLTISPLSSHTSTCLNTGSPQPILENIYK